MDSSTQTTKSGKKGKKNSKTSKTSTSTSASTNNNATVSGLNQNNIIIPIVSACVGIIIFSLIPYVVNHVHLPLTGAALNVIPNGIILGYFITDVEFENYFKGIILAPAFNVVVNILTYALYKLANFSPFWTLTVNISLWLLFVFASLFVKKIPDVV